jgi:hypothetical protein
VEATAGVAAIFIFLLLVIYSANGDVLFRDEGQGHGCIFESDQKDIEATVSRDEAIELATEWAASFHEDESLEVTDIEFRIDPLRFWLVMFKKVGTDEAFYSMVLPDRTIVEPEDEMKVWVFSNGRFIRRV